MSDAGRRIGAVVAGVVRQAVADAGAAGVLLAEAATPEGRLALRWCREALGPERVHAVVPPAGAAEIARAALDAGAGAVEGEGTTGEVARLAARLRADRDDLLLAHPANRTALLLGRRPPPEPLLPLGDLPASDVERLAGGCTLPADVRGLARSAGGVAPLDEALRRLLEERRQPESALAGVPADVAAEVLRRLEAGRFWRRRCGLVPKLGLRTIGTDLLG